MVLQSNIAVVLILMHADQQHNEQTQRILDEQRRQYQNNLLKYPTPLHKPDPYYRPNPIQN